MVMPNALGEHPRARAVTYVFGGPDAWLQDKLAVYYHPHVALKYAGGSVLYVYHGDELIYSKDLDQFLRDFFYINKDSTVVLAVARGMSMNEPVELFDAQVKAMIRDET